VQAISSWAALNEIEAVVWTGLSSNLTQQERTTFFDSWGLEHLKSLDGNGIKKAVEYIARTPAQIATRFRASVMSDEWFIREAVSVQVAV
jgi:hypothetical protein